MTGRSRRRQADCLDVRARSDDRSLDEVGLA